MLAAAMLEQVLHRSVTTSIRGASYRLKEAFRGGVPLTVPTARRESGELAVVSASNVSCGEWHRLIGDLVLATVLLDRLLHRPVSIDIRGRRYGLRGRLRSGVRLAVPTASRESGEI